MSRIVDARDVQTSGIRAYFFSNSCSAIRRDVFEQVGGFPIHTIMNEDMLFAAKLLNAGHRIAYVAESIGEHSHNYTLWQSLKRYFEPRDLITAGGYAQYSQRLPQLPDTVTVVIVAVRVPDGLDQLRVGY